MRKFFIALASAVCLVSFGGSAFAAEGLYVSGFLGVNVLADSNLGGGLELTYDAGLAVSGAVGYGVTPNVRVEGELAFRSNDLDELCFGSLCGDAGDSMSAFTFMANAFYDFDTGSSWRPYVGGGLGIAVVTLDPATGSEDDDTVFAGQLGAGVGFDITPQVILTFDYRLIVTEDPTFSTLGFTSEYLGHTLAVGARFHF